MSLAVLGTVYPVIFISELPDKTMFASLVLATRGRALALWAGVAAAFAVHVCIAVTVGAALVTVLPQRLVQASAAVLFLGGAAWVLRGPGAHPAMPGTALPGTTAAGTTAAGSDAPSPARARRVFLTAFAVVFLAEWGDLTQILTATLAARFHDPLTVGIAAGLALWSVAALAVTAGRPLRRLPPAAVRLLTASILLALAAFTAVAATTGS